MHHLNVINSKCVCYTISSKMNPPARHQLLFPISHAISDDFYAQFCLPFMNILHITGNLTWGNENQRTLPQIRHT